MTRQTTSCVRHSNNHFVQLRQDYLEMFEGDQCCAALAWLFEFQTDNEMSRLRLAEEDGEPWLSMSVNRIQSELLDTFKARAIKLRVAFFRQHELIQVDSGKGGQVNRYLFEGDLVSDFLSKRKRLPFAECTPCTQVENSVNDIAEGAAECTAEGTAEGTTCTHYKEVEYRIQKEEELPPPVPATQTSSLDLEDDPITFVQNAYKRENRRAKLDNLRARSGERTCEGIRRAESQWGAVEFRGALIAYLSDASEWLREKRWPVHVFLKQVGKYVPDSPQAPRASRQDGPGSIAAHASATYLPPPADAGLKTGVVFPELPELPFAAQEWNRVVTAAPPVDQWTRRDESLTAAVTDSDFLAALPQVLASCQSAFESQNASDVDWLNFRWLLRKKDKSAPENWYRIRSGEMNWLRHKRGASSPARGSNSNGYDVAQAYLAKLEKSKGDAILCK